MTDRLYYDDAYLMEFDAHVLECVPDGAQYRVLLDRSAFYPTSGGQPYDTGFLGAARVLDVNVEGGQVWHTVDAPLPAGEAVHGSIDWARRFDHMQQHAGDHMIAGALHRRMGGVTIGLHISEDVSTIDVAMPEGITRITPEELRQIEADVNERIQRDVPIRCWFPDDKELAGLPLRKKPTVSEHVRIVAIGDDEMVACGGTHPRRAGELGLVKIVSVAPARGKMRVSFLAGQRALRDYDRCHDAVRAAAQLLSTTADGLAGSVAALQERLHAAEFALDRMKQERLMEHIPALLAGAEALPTGAKLVTGFADADAASLKELVSRLIQQPGIIALMGAKTGGSAVYVFGRSADVTADIGKLLRECAQPMGGKGGGRPDFAQGGGCEEILERAVEWVRGMGE